MIKRIELFDDKIGAVEYVDHDADVATEIFGRFCLTRACRASRCPTHH